MKTTNTKRMDYKEITTIEKIFEAAGMMPDQQPDFSKCREKDREPLKALYLMELAIEVINPPDFVADLSDYGQTKIYLWPDVVKDDSQPSGFGFSYDVWATAAASAGVGSRRAFADRARARHFWEYFKDLFITYSVKVKQ